ncbi:MAG: circularly permuted type 2 ATP-grasp protein [Planctomycetaceae bacterium]
MQLAPYQSIDSFDEMFDPEGQPRPSAAQFVDRLLSLSDNDLQQRQKAAELSLKNMGITFNVYGHEAGTEKVWPFDLLPRIIDAGEWTRIEQGLKQRIKALNLFISDVYNERKIFKDGVVPEELLMTSKSYRKQCEGFMPPQGAWCHITGVDLIRDRDGQVYVLEDNLRCPSGVSYVLENRELMKRTFAPVFQGMSVAPIEDYSEQLLQTLLDCGSGRSQRSNRRRVDSRYL